MQIDLETVASGTSFRSDVCIVGGGVAGLILASRLTEAGLEVHLLEAGGLTNEERSQSLYDARMVGNYHHGTRSGRHRFLGGSSTHWAGQLLSYTDEIFLPRPEVAHVGWPISGADIASYYPEIFRIMGVNALPFENFLLDGGPTFPVESDDMRIRFSKWAPFQFRNLGKTLGKKCLQSERMTLFLHANALSIELGREGGRVEKVIAKNYQGGTTDFTARQFIICAGTIETSRLLLASNSFHPAGVGNRHDQVGRYFHDHVGIVAAGLSLPDRSRLMKWFSPYFIQNTLHTAKLEATARLKKEKNLLAVSAYFSIEESSESGIAMVRHLMRALQGGRLPAEAKLDPKKIPRQFYDLVRTWVDLKVRGRRYPSRDASITLRMEVEQVPRADSRIGLIEKTDALGMRIASVDWKQSAEEGKSLRDYSSVVDAALKSLGAEGPQWNRSLSSEPEEWLKGSFDMFHPMGGARMGTDPATSVVDRDLRVHGIGNLYIASCAVFPTGGSSNSTFTLMALALRLADRLALSRS